MLRCLSSPRGEPEVPGHQDQAHIDLFSAALKSTEHEPRDEVLFIYLSDIQDVPSRHKPTH